MCRAATVHLLCPKQKSSLINRGSAIHKAPDTIDKNDNQASIGDTELQSSEAIERVEMSMRNLFETSVLASGFFRLIFLHNGIWSKLLKNVQSTSAIRATRHLYWAMLELRRSTVDSME